MSAGQIAAVDRAPYPVFPSQRRVYMGEHRYLTYEQIWKHQPQVRTVIGFIARSLAEVAAHVMKVDPTTGAMTPDVTHPLDRIFANPVPITGTRWTRYKLFNDAFHCRLLFDNAYWLKLAPAAGSAQGILPLLPKFVSPMGENWFQPEGYRVRGNMGEYVVPPEAICHFYGWNPFDPRVGESPIETLRNILAEEFSATEYRTQMWNKGARTSGVIVRPADAPDWGETERDRFLASWDSAYSSESRQAGGTPILEDGMQWVASGMTPKDAQYVESRQLTLAECMAAYHLPSWCIAAVQESQPLTQLADMRAQLYGDYLMPWAVEMAQDIELQLLSDIDPSGYNSGSAKVHFPLDKKMRANPTMELQANVAAAGGPWRTRQEIRAEYHLAPLPPESGADELIVPMNVTVGGQANPNDTAPDNPSNDASNGGSGLATTTTFAPAGAPKGKARQDPKAHVVVGDPTELAAAVKGFYQKMGASVTARVGAAAKARKDVSVPANTISTADVFDADRWNAHLVQAIQPVMAATAAKSGKKALMALGQDPAQYSAALVENYMAAKADGVADSVIGNVRDNLADSLATADPLDSVQQLFANYISSRADSFAASMTQDVAAFGANDAADKAGLPPMQKQWQTGDGGKAGPRASHAAMDGETVDRGDTFSNGLRWPGDSSGSPEEVDGCDCSLALLPPDGAGNDDES